MACQLARDGIASWEVDVNAESILGVISAMVSSPTIQEHRTSRRLRPASSLGIQRKTDQCNDEDHGLR